MRVQDFLDDDIAGFAGTDHHDGDAVVLVGVPVLHASEEPVGKPADEGQRDQKEHIHEMKALRYRLLLDLEKRQNDNARHPRQHTRDHKILQLRFPGERPERIIELQKPENRDGCRDKQRHRAHHRNIEILRHLCDMKFIPDQKRERAGEDDAHNIVKYERGPSPELGVIKRFFCLSVVSHP